MKKLSEYDIQAGKFLEATETTMEAVYLGHYPRLDEHAVSQWQITFTRRGREPYRFTFSQSLNGSWVYTDYKERGAPKRQEGIPHNLKKEYWPTNGEQKNLGQFTLYPVKNAPTAYDVLACITKYDPGTFKNFCSDFGYDTDSRKGFAVYTAVQEEWGGVNGLFGDHMDELGEIQ